MSGFSHKITMIFYGCKILHQSAPVISKDNSLMSLTLNSSVNNFLERLICIAE